MDYCTATEVRSYSGIATGEMPDADLNMLISGSMADIDRQTGRTWMGIATAVNEYYKGGGSDTLYLDHMDVWELTTIAIDDDDDETYTQVTPSKVKVYTDEGILVLRNDAEVTIFPAIDKATKISYTYGAASGSVPKDIQNLCIWCVTNQLGMMISYKCE